MTTTRLVLPLLLALAACGEHAAPSSSSAAPAAGAAPRTITIGLVAKSQGNAVFQAAYAGAKAAAKQLGAQRGVTVLIDWQTPPEENPQKQAEAIEQLARAGAPGIAVSCSDANTLTAAIDKAVELGSQVMCFDSDAPRSKRFAFFGTDDETCGRMVLQELAAAMGDKGTVAILAGNQTAPNLQARVQGVKDELRSRPQMKLLEDGVFYHPETPEQAAETMNRAQSSHPEIGGWALVGGWPLFTHGALHWPAGSVKVVSVDALPPQLQYLKDGYVSVLLAQDCYGWGWRSVEVLLDKILDGKDPQGGARIVDPLTQVRAADADEWSRKWAGWTGG